MRCPRGARWPRAARPGKAAAASAGPTGMGRGRWEERGAWVTRQQACIPQTQTPGGHGARRGRGDTKADCRCPEGGTVLASPPRGGLRSSAPESPRGHREEAMTTRPHGPASPPPGQPCAPGDTGSSIGKAAWTSHGLGPRPALRRSCPTAPVSTRGRPPSRDARASRPHVPTRGHSERVHEAACTPPPAATGHGRPCERVGVSRRLQTAHTSAPPPSSGRKSSRTGSSAGPWERPGCSH